MKLDQEKRKKAREAFNELLNEQDDDPHAVTTALTVEALLKHRQRNRQERKTVQQPNEKGSR